MNPKELILIHDCNKIDRAVSILKNGILPSLMSKIKNFFELNGISLSAVEYEEIIDKALIWGHIRFVINEKWIINNSEHFKHYSNDYLGNNKELWSRFIEKYSLEKYSGEIRIALNQIICDIPIPLEAIECIILYDQYGILNKELELLKLNKPKNIKLYYNLKESMKLQLIS